MRNKNIVFILALSLTSNYGFIITKGIFYNIIKSALCLSDVQLGYIWSVYGIVSMLGFPVGGFLADFFRPKKMICLATAITVTLHLMLASLPSYPVLLFIAAMFGIATIFIYYPAATKMIVSMYRDDSAGTAMGMYYALDGLYMFLTNMAFSLIYRVNGSSVWVFRGIMVTFAVLGILALILTVCCVPEPEIKKNIPQENGKGAAVPGDHAVLEIIKRPEAWLIAGIIVSGYTLFSFSTYVTPYLSEIWNVSEKDNLILAVVRGNVLNVAAGLFYGRWCARWKSAIKTMRAGFLLLTVFPVLSIWNQKVHGPVLLEVLITSVSVFLILGIKAISTSAITEVEYPQEVTGRVLGIVSLVGFSPDVWFYPIAGWMLEIYGKHAYRMFTWMAFLPIAVGILCAQKLLKKFLTREKVSDIT